MACLAYHFGSDDLVTNARRVAFNFDSIGGLVAPIRNPSPERNRIYLRKEGKGISYRADDRRKEKVHLGENGGERLHV